MVAMNVTIKLDDLSCLEQQELGSDEIYLQWSFREASQPAKLERLPAGKTTWTGKMGSREQLDHELVTQAIEPGREYVLELSLWEQDKIGKDDLLGSSKLAIKASPGAVSGAGPQLLRASEEGADYELTYTVTVTG